MDEVSGGDGSTDTIHRGLDLSVLRRKRMERKRRKRRERKRRRRRGDGSMCKLLHVCICVIHELVNT